MQREVQIVTVVSRYETPAIHLPQAVFLIGTLSKHREQFPIRSIAFLEKASNTKATQRQAI